MSENRYAFNRREQSAFKGMEMKRIHVVLILLVALCLPVNKLLAGPFLDFEGGIVYSGYNDVRIPGDTGTKFSLVDDLDTDSAFFVRLRLGITLFQRHTVSFLYAPLTLRADGFINRTVMFDDAAFSAGSYLQAKFRFDSYRLTYRYDFISNDILILGAGLTAKIRDAAIRLESAGISSEKNNTGFVPLINLRLQWNVIEPMSFIFEADALWAPQGRAEDLLFALQLNVSPNLSLRAGYRMLEGGADNDEVYTFSLLHYVVFGFTFTY